MLHYLNTLFPIRYTVFGLSCFGLLLSLFSLLAFGEGLGALVLCGFLTGIGIYDVRQDKRSVLRNYPIIGHIRYMLEFVRPEIRQYFIESDKEAAPFSRAQRSLVYQRAKGEPDKQPFGTQLDVHAEGYEWMNHSVSPTSLTTHDFRVTVGADRAQPYSMSVFNISAMSFGALSANAILALNGGAKRGGFAHDTGEGSISQHHRVHGGDLVWEIGSGYFGCRNDDGTFNAEKFAANARDPQVRMIEIKLSQGAKPGHGGVLPGPKVTEDLERIVPGYLPHCQRLELADKDRCRPDTFPGEGLREDRLTGYPVCIDMGNYGCIGMRGKFLCCCPNILPKTHHPSNLSIRSKMLAFGRSIATGTLPGFVSRALPHNS